MASVSCASWLIDPYDIAPVANRLTIDSTGSTSSIGIGVSGVLELEQAAQRRELRVLVVDERVYSLKIEYWPLRVACCSLKTVSGLKR